MVAAERDLRLGSLPDAVAALVDPTRRRVLVEVPEVANGETALVSRWMVIRAVLDELLVSVAPSGQGGGGGRGSGAAASLEAIDLLDRLRQLVDVAMRDAGLPHRRDPRVCRCGWSAADCVRLIGPLPPSGAPLRCCSACWHPPARHPLADALARLAVHGWADPADAVTLAARLRRLTDQIAAFLSGDHAGVYVRDTRCPRCGAWDVRELIDGSWARHPALHVEMVGGRVEGTACTACEWWWSRAMEDQLCAELAADAARMRREGDYRRVS